MPDESDHSLYGLVGLLSDEEVERVREASEWFRESLNEGMEATADQLKSS